MPLIPKPINMAGFRTVVKSALFAYSPYNTTEMQGFGQAIVDSIRSAFCYNSLASGPAADRKELRSGGQQHAGARDGVVAAGTGRAGGGSRADEPARGLERLEVGQRKRGTGISESMARVRSQQKFPGYPVHRGGECRSVCDLDYLVKQFGRFRS